MSDTPGQSLGRGNLGCSFEHLTARISARGQTSAASWKRLDAPSQFSSCLILATCFNDVLNARDDFEQASLASCR